MSMTFDSIEYLKKELENSLFDDPNYALDIKAGGHAYKHITEQSDKEMIERIVAENVSGVGVFQSEEEALDHIQNAAIFNLDEICSWATKHKYEFSNPREFHQLTFTIYMGKSELVGKNLENNGDRIEETISHAVTMVLRRNPDAPFGFSLTTAYPNTRHPSTEKTGKVYSKEDVMKMYSFRSNVERAAFLIRGKEKGVEVQCKSEGGKDYLRVFMRAGNYEYLAYIQKHKERITRRGNDGTFPIDMDTLKRDNPSMYTAIKSMQKIIEYGAQSLDDTLARAEAVRHHSSSHHKEEKTRKNPRNME